jgi:hypothetical protein
VVKQRITRCKTEASRKPIPLDPELAEVLLSWRLQSPYPLIGDRVFAGWFFLLDPSESSGKSVKTCKSF